MKTVRRQTLQDLRVHYVACFRNRRRMFKNAVEAGDYRAAANQLVGLQEGVKSWQRVKKGRVFP